MVEKSTASYTISKCIPCSVGLLKNVDRQGPSRRVEQARRPVCGISLFAWITTRAVREPRALWQRGRCDSGSVVPTEFTASALGGPRNYTQRWIRLRWTGARDDHRAVVTGGLKYQSPVSRFCWYWLFFEVVIGEANDNRVQQHRQASHLEVSSCPRRCVPETGSGRELRETFDRPHRFDEWPTGALCWFHDDVRCTSLPPVSRPSSENNLGSAKALNRNQLLVLMAITRAYRTAPSNALQVLAGKRPFDLKVRKRSQSYICRKALTNRLSYRALVEVDAELTTEWQNRWDAAHGGWIAYALVHAMRRRLAQRWSRVDRFSAQFATGHGAFRTYLHRFALSGVQVCSCDEESTEDSLHTLLQYHSYAEQR